jgi:hypothetical protein
MPYKPTTMTNKLRYLLCTLVLVTGSFVLQAQDTLNTSGNRITYLEREREQIIPDRVFEMGIPFLLILLVLNTITTIFKIKAETQLKEKALEKGISEATLIELFKEDKQMARNAYLKWFLVLAAIGVALIYIHMLHQYVRMSSGYMSLGMVALFISVAFLIYYRIIRRQR